jgi:hypothetical protein
LSRASMFAPPLLLGACARDPYRFIAAPGVHGHI